MEEDIVKLQDEIKVLEQERQKAEPQQPINMDKVHRYVSYYLEHLDELLLHFGNPVLQARYFGVIFNQAPTYDDIVFGTPDCTKITGVNAIFRPKNFNPGLMAGETAAIWNHVLEDYTLVAKRLEKLGFSYYDGDVTVTTGFAGAGHV